MNDTDVRTTGSQQVDAPCRCGSLHRRSALLPASVSVALLVAGAIIVVHELSAALPMPVMATFQTLVTVQVLLTIATACSARAHAALRLRSVAGGEIGTVTGLHLLAAGVRAAARHRTAAP